MSEKWAHSMRAPTVHPTVQPPSSHVRAPCNGSALKGGNRGSRRARKEDDGPGGGTGGVGAVAIARVVS